MQIAIKKNKVTGLTLAVCLFAAIFLGIIFLPDLPFQSWDFQSNLWGPAYLLVHGWSPYDIHHIIPDTNAVWLPMVVGLFAPLGLLSQAAAEKFWFLLTIAALFLIIWLSCNQKLLKPLPFTLVLVAVFLFPPTLLHINYGQFSVLATALFLMVAMVPLPVILRGFLLALAISKPQLGLLFIPGIFLYEYRAHGKANALALFGSSVVGSVTLSLPLFLVQPDFYKKLIENILGNNSWAQPSSLSFLKIQFGNARTWIWIFLAGIIFIVNLWIWIHYPSQKAVLWCLALTALVSPYLWSWDFVMLLPLAVSLFAELRTKYALFLLIAGFAGCDWIEISMRLGRDVPDDLHWWIPIYFLTVFLASLILDRLLTSQTQTESMPLHKY